MDIVDLTEQQIGIVLADDATRVEVIQANLDRVATANEMVGVLVSVRAEGALQSAGPTMGAGFALAAAAAVLLGGT